MPVKLQMKVLPAVLAALALATAWAFTSAASAQDEIALESAIPAPDSEVPTSPTQLTLTFSQELSSLGVSVFITDAAGNPQQRGAVQVGSDRRTAIVPLPEPLDQGEYRVDWRVTNALGRVVSDTYTFRVNESAPETTTPPATDTGTTVPTDTTVPTSGGGSAPSDRSYGTLLVLARFVTYLGIAAFAGGIMLIVLAWNEGPEYVLTARFLRAGWVAGLAGSLLVLAATSAELSGSSVAAGFNPSSWADVADSSAGKALIARVVILALCVWVALQPERIVDPGTQLAAVGLPLLAAATLGLTRLGEARYAAVAIPAGVVHALGVTAWFGGVALLGRVVLTGPGEGDLVEAVVGFNRIATPAMLATIVGGAIQTASLLGGLGNVVSTGYGRIFLMKVLIAVFMVYVAALNRQVVASRLPRTDHLTAPAAARLRRAVSTEALCGVVVFALSGWLVGSVPPAIDDAGIPRDSIRKTVVSADDNVSVEVVIFPGRVGTNGMRFTVERPEDGLANVIVRLTDPAGRANGVVFTLPLTGAGTFDVPIESGFPLGAPGTWNVEIAPTPVAGVLPVLQTTVVVRNADGSEPDISEPETTATTTTATSSSDASSTSDQTSTTAGASG